MGSGPTAGGLRGRLRRFIITASGILTDGVTETVSLLSSGRPQVIIGSVGYLGFDIVVLAACFRAFGPAPPVGTLLLAHVLGQLGGLLPLPGGVGGIDAGLIGAFVIYGEPIVPVTTAVLVYHAMRLLLPVLPGVPAFAGSQPGPRRGPNGHLRAPWPRRASPPAGDRPTSKTWR